MTLNTGWKFLFKESQNARPERESNEAKEGLAAFLEKRPPRWDVGQISPQLRKKPLQFSNESFTLGVLH